MFNTRIICINTVNDAEEEIRKIGVEDGAIPWLLPKALYFTVKVENVSPFAANVIKQEMLSKGGDAAVNRGVANCSVEKSDILIMGTYGQYMKLLSKLKLQSGSLKEIAGDIERTLKNAQGNGPGLFECGGFRLPMRRKTYVMGILNITPDSFSDGGKYDDTEAAVKRAKEMVEDGAHMIDVGGESTRPGYEPVDPSEEVRRVVPVIKRLSAEISVPISIDTSKAVVAREALKAGAHIVNDIWGLQGDKAMAGVVSDYKAGVIMMHNKNDKDYKDLMGDIIKFLLESISIAEKAGVKRECMAVDPGIGFGKTAEDNIGVLRRLKELESLGLPVLLGTSRKSFIGNILDLPVGERLEGTAATVSLGIAGGADIVRVHDVKEMARVARVADSVVRLRNTGLEE